MLEINSVSETQTSNLQPHVLPNPSKKSLSLKEQLLALAQVQEVDLKIDQLNNRKKALPAHLKALDQNVAQLEATLNAKTAELGEIEKKQKQSKAAIELNQDRMGRSSKKLEGVQNSQEFQAASKEIEQLKKMNADLESQQVKFTQDVEAIQKTVADLNQQIEKVKSERQSKVQEVEGETGKLDKDLGELTIHRNSFAVDIQPQVLSRYDRVRGARAGVGVAAAIAGRCTVCNLMVPPQMFNELQKALEVMHCPSCHRLLYVPNS